MEVWFPNLKSGRKRSRLSPPKFTASNSSKYNRLDSSKSVDTVSLAPATAVSGIGKKASSTKNNTKSKILEPSNRTYLNEYINEHTSRQCRSLSPGVSCMESSYHVWPTICCCGVSSIYSHRWATLGQSKVWMEHGWTWQLHATNKESFWSPHQTHNNLGRNRIVFVKWRDCSWWQWPCVPEIARSSRMTRCTNQIPRCFQSCDLEVRVGGHQILGKTTAGSHDAQMYLVKMMISHQTIPKPYQKYCNSKTVSFSDIFSSKNYDLQWYHLMLLKFDSNTLLAILVKVKNKELELHVSVDIQTW